MSIQILSYEEWKKQYSTEFVVDDEFAAEFNKFHDLDVYEVIENGLKYEYKEYLRTVYSQPPEDENE